MSPANDDTAKVMQPGEQTFDVPMAPVAAQSTPVLGRHSGAHRPERRDEFHAVSFQDALIQRIAVVCAITDHALREVGEESLVERGSYDLVSCGEALATCTETGKPWPSAMAMILLPLPRFAEPTPEPLFSPR